MQPCVGKYERIKEDERDHFSDRWIYIKTSKSVPKQCNVKFISSGDSVVCFDADGRPCEIHVASEQARRQLAARRKTPRAPNVPPENISEQESRGDRLVTYQQ